MWCAGSLSALRVCRARGGGEFGITWRDAGSVHNKQNVFDDFIGCAEHLIREKYTSPAKLVTQVCWRPSAALFWCGMLHHVQCEEQALIAGLPLV